MDERDLARRIRRFAWRLALSDRTEEESLRALARYVARLVVRRIVERAVREAVDAAVP